MPPHQTRILLSIPSSSHIALATDELDGLQALGYHCSNFAYAAKEGTTSSFGRLLTLVINALALVKKAYQFKPDIIYFNSRLEVIGSTRDLISILLFKLFYFKKVLLMIKSHGSDLDILEDQRFFFKSMVIPFLSKNIAAWLFLSNEEKDIVIANGSLPAARIFVAKNVVRLNQLPKEAIFSANLGIPVADVVLLFTGRMIREKGIYEIMDAFIFLEKTYPITLLLVGDGPASKQLKKIVENRELSHKIIFTGFMPEAEVTPYYANADILILPTYCTEGFSMSLFNAVAAGLAVVTTPIRAAADYLTAPDNCLWVEPRNSGSVALALTKLLKSPQLRNEMGLNNRLKAQSFSKEVVSKEISAIIETTLMANRNAKIDHVQ